jgi:N-acetylmuramoyl-L-alanine amidase-like protein
VPKILLQKGHHAPRERGFEDGTGAAGEQEVVGVLVDVVAAKLKADKRFTVRVIPGAVPANVKSGGDEVDAFVSFHCDGSSDSNRKGWGVGYPIDPINRGFAQRFAAEYARIQPSKRLSDNYTDNMLFYYGWSRVPTSGPEILVEHGFVSSPAEKRWLLANADQIADCYYKALLAEFDLTVKPTPTPTPANEVKQLRAQNAKQATTIKALRKRIRGAQDALSV